MPDNTKIERIKIGSVTHEIVDATALHEVKTINGAAINGSGNVTLSDIGVTSISDTEITNLFEGSGN